MDRLRFRQIHLDFHTSEAIPGVGKDWDKKHFQEMLKLGHVDSINIFGKCHHGWCYFNTETPLARRHPSLNFDLLGAMIEACREIDVKCPVYISAGLDEQIARTHTEWLRRSVDGSTTWAGWLQAGYHVLCMRTPYLDYLVAQTEEVCRKYRPDGLWMDIVGVNDCACTTCVAEMVRRGLDPLNEADRLTLGRETYLNYARRINSAARAIAPDVMICHNAGHILRGERELADLHTHFELESLPTGGWGYDHFPMSARYVQNLMGKEFLGMSGKFHTSWGEFGGYKHPNALRFESALALANGGKFCVGDQMHPYGRLDRATYSLIGKAYSEVEQKQAWCDDVEAISDIAILSVEAETRRGGAMQHNNADEGAVRVMQQSHFLYDVIDRDAEFGKYAVIVLPDAIGVDEPLKARLNTYLAGGGKILATGMSAVDETTGEFVLPFGARRTGIGQYKPTYIAPRFELAEWDPAAFVVYSEMQTIEPTGAEVLADRQDPFFNRAWNHFCSHQHAPSTMKNAGAAIVKTANTVYIAFPAFSLYYDLGQAALREIIATSLRSLLERPTLATNLPSLGIQTVQRQREKNRTVVHLLYASPVKRGANIEVLEDLIPVRDVDVALRSAKQPARVYLAPQMTDLPFTYAGGIVKTRVPEFTCHQMVVVE